jgi:glycosyltransferase XagB
MDIFLLITALIIIIQSIFTIFTMIFVWETHGQIQKSSSPSKFATPTNNFTILIPAYNEQKVISDTIESIANFNYPRDKFEVLVLLRIEDTETIEISNRKIQELKSQKNYLNLKIILVDSVTKNKPNQLNHGLKQAKGNYIAIFDAEDEPSREILNIVNTIILRDDADVVQCGVQLMNFRSNWFSTLNVLEYYFWFKSCLLLFAKNGITPLGGNSVFVRTNLMNKVGGWNENCLTEDAELGFRLSKLGARTSIMYDHNHATKEETPPTTISFVKQRTRWIQGFLQIFLEFEWISLIKTPAKLLLCLYVLLWPLFQILFVVYFMLAIFVVPFVKVSLVVAIISVFPIFMVIIQLAILNYGLWQFTRDYKLKYPIWMPLKIIITYIPYQLILSISALRAIVKILQKNTTWEKTTHLNSHRIN